jgi:quercetin dioxygenase-like cupin family protein
MEIKRSGSQPSGKAPADYFTGTVRVDPLFEAHPPARALGVSVMFELGARTAWHTHPLGRDLMVTVGCGLVQRWDGPIEKIRPGDVVWIPPGEKHWHDATAITAMTHIAIQKQLDGKTAGWMEKVSDEQYQAQSLIRPTPRRQSYSCEDCCALLKYCSTVVGLRANRRYPERLILVAHTSRRVQQSAESNANWPPLPSCGERHPSRWPISFVRQAKALSRRIDRG